LEGTIEKIKKEMQQQSRFTDKLLNEQTTLQQRLGKGHYDSSSTKILRLKVSPEEIRVQQQQAMAYVRISDKYL